jgi:arylsulfatase A-like enzyme
MVHASEPDFGGVVGATAAESTPWWPELSRPASGTPNVVVIVLDDVGYADFGAYGSEVDTEHIDALAEGGLRYTGFHTTTLCSPSRACLLTGRNHHSVGMSMVAEWDTGFPNSRSRITPAAATLAEVLSDAGVATFAVGKWHLAPPHETTQAGPFHNWPLGKGFDRYYGFLAGYTDQYFPELVRDNSIIGAPGRPEDGYHLSEDLVDQATSFLTDHLALAPERPFYLHLSFGACHWPLQAPAAYLEKYRGRYDEGWDVVRAARSARQLELGVVPEGTELSPRNDGVPAWDELSEEERRFAARLQEAYAAFLDHTDDQIGRFVDFLRTTGTLDDTIVVLLSDNGASQEGGPSGYLNFSRFFNILPTDLQAGLERLDEIGGPTVQPAYPTGWAQVSNTPLRRYKGNTHEGGVRDPLIVHWPSGIADPGGIRTRFQHVIDVYPTLLEVLGLDAPEVRAGIAQLPVHGRSFADGFAATEPAPAASRAQYFEMGGHRAIWVDGWKAVAFHIPYTPFEHDRWELYHLDSDFSEVHDLAAAEPERLAALIEQWWRAAEEFGVLPLDDRLVERMAELGPPGTARHQRSFTFWPGASRVPPVAVPTNINRSFELRAEVERAEGDDGVLVAHGGVGGGYVWYVQDGRLVYEYDRAGTRTRVVSDEVVPVGASVLGLRFTRTGTLAGTATLLVDGDPVGSVEVPRTLGVVASTGGFQVGADTQSPASPNYVAPFVFAGRLGRVTVELGDDLEALSIMELLVPD